MSGAVTAIATAVSAVAADAVGFTASSLIIDTVSSVAYSAATIGITTGIAAGIGAAFAPKIPDPQALQIPLKQAMPVRQSAFGRVRVGGAYAFFGTGVGTAKALSIDMLAMLDGRSSAIVARYLNDDLMAPVGDYWYAPGAPGKYGGGGSNPPNLVQFDHRLGLPTETSYSEITPALPLWDANHRGDGVTSLALYCKPARREDQSGDFPNGLPTPSAVFDAQLVYDPRDGGQTQGDASTYVFSDNPVLCLLAYLTDASGGMGLDYARFILPAISFWTGAPDECDGVVSTSGMHATLLDAADVGDNKIFLADTTGLTAGVAIDISGVETVTVSGLGLAGEVDIVGTLAYAHGAGQLAYWDTAGQQTRYRCALTYRHDTPPGDVIKSILSSFDGWLGQRGDGALVVRTNALYAPTVTLEDRHIVGYQLVNYLPDEQATNQLIVSYTDPASGFNKAEAGYVQDDIDIAARGQVRSQELYLQSVPSGPQAIAVARAVLARATQPVRLTLTCNLAGLGVLGERYVGLNVMDPVLATANGIVEITGKPTIDLSSMTVSFPAVAVSNRSGFGPQAICFALDVSTEGGGWAHFDQAQAAVSETLSLVAANQVGALDVCVIAWGYDSHVTTSITRRSASTADLLDIKAWVDALTPDPTNTDPTDAMNAAKTFFDATDSAITNRSLFVLTDGAITDSAHGATIAAAAGTILATMPGVSSYAICVHYLSPTAIAWMSEYDNTPDDGVPIATSTADLTAIMEQALFRSVTSAGSSYTLPPLAPPSGSPLQPLTAPTITSVTPVYPNSGGGVAGARLSIVVGDPGLTATWKIQWKLSADSVWTDGGSSIDADSFTILSGLIPASGSVDVQAAYVTASQVSPWSATTTTTIAAPVGAVASTSKGASFTTTAANNVYYVDTASAAITVTLNAAPAANESVEIWDSTGHAGTNPISLAGNGKTIAGASTVANAVQINFGKIKLIYNGTQWLAS